MKTKAPDQVAATELRLYLQNDYEIYCRCLIPAVKNMKTKKNKGVYDHSLAPKLWMHVVEECAKRYSKEYGGTWYEIFDLPTRRKLANDLADHYSAMIDDGEI